VSATKYIEEANIYGEIVELDLKEGLQNLRLAAFET
jgi:hypothetical protein